MTETSPIICFQLSTVKPIIIKAQYKARLPDLRILGQAYASASSNVPGQQLQSHSLEYRPTQAAWHAGNPLGPDSAYGASTLSVAKCASNGDFDEGFGSEAASTTKGLHDVIDPA